MKHKIPNPAGYKPTLFEIRLMNGLAECYEALRRSGMDAVTASIIVRLSGFDYINSLPAKNPKQPDNQWQGEEHEQLDEESFEF